MQYLPTINVTAPAISLARACPLVLLFFLAGCHAGPGRLLPHGTTKYSIENTEKVLLMDRPTQASVTCTGLQERINPDGYLEIVANIKNREDYRNDVQVRCVFKDRSGFSTGDETPWQTLVLGNDATEIVHYTAVNSRAHKYTIAVRQARPPGFSP